MELTGTQIWPARIRRVLWWIIPIIFLFGVYFNGLRTWFVADDFAWLGLIRDVHNFRDLLFALFSPAAQGTIRPWSERGFFLLFESLFGLDDLPFRICVFTTMAVDIVLVAWLTRRITGSPAAGFLAPVLWTANTALVTVMAWSSAYNEALCALFLLTAMVLLVRYTETGRVVFWWWQLVVFILAFGALEVTIVYPALAAAYVWFVAPPEKRNRLLLSLTPLFCISVAYFLVHRAVAPLPTDGVYAVRVDSRMLQTLALYWKWSLLPQTWRSVGNSTRTGNLIVWLLTIALAAFFIREITRRRNTVLFFVFWFLITLAPMIPLPDHRTDYYLTIPLIGLAMLGGAGIAQALERPWVWKIAALIPMAAYLSGMLPVTRVASRWWLDRTLPVRSLVLGVAAAHEKHPGKTIVLDGVTSALYSDAVADSAFYPLGLTNVYLTPNARDSIHPESGLDRFSRAVIDPGALENGITHEQVVVYSYLGNHLRNDTEAWERSYSSRLSLNQTPDQVPRRVDVGNPLLAYLLGPEWFPVESSRFRWMPRRATVRLGGPRSEKDKLLLEGYCPDQQLKAGILHLSVSVDGISLASTEIGGPENKFRRLFVMPPSLVGRNSVEVAVSVDRAMRGSDRRELGLVFGTIAIEQ